MNKIESLMTTITDKLSSQTTFRQIPSILNLIPPFYKIPNITISDEFKQKSELIDNLYFKYEFFRNDNLIAYIVLWQPKITSCIHDHSDLGCYYKPLTTGLIEHRYTMMDDYLHYTMHKNCCPTYAHYINDYIGLHSMENSNMFIVSSVHVYPNFDN